MDHLPRPQKCFFFFICVPDNVQESTCYKYYDKIFPRCYAFKHNIWIIISGTYDKILKYIYLCYLHSIVLRNYITHCEYCGTMIFFPIIIYYIGKKFLFSFWYMTIHNTKYYT